VIRYIIYCISETLQPQNAWNPSNHL